jgi:hypothetical protein
MTKYRRRSGVKCWTPTSLLKGSRLYQRGNSVDSHLVLPRLRVMAQVPPASTVFPALAGPNKAR